MNDQQQQALIIAKLQFDKSITIIESMTIDQFDNMQKFKDLVESRENVILIYNNEVKFEIANSIFSRAQKHAIKTLLITRLAELHETLKD